MVQYGNLFYILDLGAVVRPISWCGERVGEVAGRQILKSTGEQQYNFSIANKIDATYVCTAIVFYRAGWNIQAFTFQKSASHHVA